MRMKVIDNKGISFRDYLKEIWHYRYLVWTFALRQIRIKFAQTTLGLLWIILNPLISLLILMFVFGEVSDVVSTDLSGVQLILSGLLVWTWFSAAVNDSTNTIISFQNMIRKIYFPKITIPLSSLFSTLPDVLIILIIWLGLSYSLHAIPGFVSMLFGTIITVIAILTASIWSAYLTARFRDFKYIIPVLLRLGLFITPIGYQNSNVQDKYRYIVDLNPISLAISFFRGTSPSEVNKIQLLSVLIIVLLLILGLYVFRKLENTIADII